MIAAAIFWVVWVVALGSVLAGCAALIRARRGANCYRDDWLSEKLAFIAFMGAIATTVAVAALGALEALAQLLG